MAEKKASTKKSIKGTETLRERAAKVQGKQPRRVNTTASKLRQPLGRARNVGKKEFHLPLPDNRVGRILRKRVRLLPKFIHEAWAEIKLVTWPSRNDTLRLTMAVFIFSIIFGVIVGVLDFGLDKLFKKFILG